MGSLTAPIGTNVVSLDYRVLVQRLPSLVRWCRSRCLAFPAPRHSS